jgi:peptidoglycan hydrolase-like protein with peptidoglycan-binding domain
MKTYLLVILAAMFMFSGCSKKQQALEEMQQPLTPDDLTRIKTQTSESANAPGQAPAEATIVSTLGQKLEPLPPAGPFKPSVKEIQAALKNAGVYSGEIDGKLGPMSKKAVEEFQRTNGLAVDGKVGPKTWVALSKYLNPTAGSESGK